MLNTLWFFHIQVKKEDLDFGWGIVVNFQKKTNVKVLPDALCAKLMYNVLQRVIYFEESNFTSSYEIDVSITL